MHMRACTAGVAMAANRCGWCYAGSRDGGAIPSNTDVPFIFLHKKK